MDYRAYVLDDSGRVFTYAPITAENDEEAIQKATQLKDGRDIEVWHLDRKVTLIKAAT